MKLLFTLGIVLLCMYACAGCTITPGPEPLPTGDGTCETSCENLRSLGGCGLEMATCEADCRDAVAAEAEVSLGPDLGCMTKAEDCETVGRCQ